MTQSSNGDHITWRISTRDLYAESAHACWYRRKARQHNPLHQQQQHRGGWGSGADGLGLWVSRLHVRHHQNMARVRWEFTLNWQIERCAEQPLVLCSVVTCARYLFHTGRFTDVQRVLYEAVLEIQETCVARCLIGNSLEENFHHMLSLVSKQLERIGIMAEPKDAVSLVPVSTCASLRIETICSTRSRKLRCVGHSDAANFQVTLLQQVERPIDRAWSFPVS